MKKSALLIFLISCFTFQAHSQVLISLLLGDKLNSDKLEFGLIGGLQMSNVSNYEESKMYNALHLGFYFDFIMNDKFSFHPAVLVKSTAGFRYTNRETSVSGVEDVDSLLLGAEVKRKIRYFQVPLLMKYNLTPRFHVMLGPQVGIRTKVYNEYSVEDGNDIFDYSERIDDHYKRIDAGFTTGLGFKLKPKDGMNLGVRYYYGFTDILKDNTGDRQSNRDLYIYVTVPIGKGKAAKQETAD